MKKILFVFGFILLSVFVNAQHINWTQIKGSKTGLSFPLSDSLYLRLNIDGTVSALTAPVFLSAIGGGAGGGGNLEYDFELSENISAGKIVELLTNGTIKAISSTANSQSIPSMSPLTVSNATAYNSFYPEIKFDPILKNRFVVVWRDQSTGYAKMIVGMYGSTITLGSVTTVSDLTLTSIRFSFDYSEKGRFIIYGLRGGAMAYVGYILDDNSVVRSSEITITAAVDAGYGYETSIVVFPEINRIVTTYRAQSTGYGCFKISRFEGMNIRSGSEYTFNSAQTYFISAAGDNFVKNRFVIAYRDNGNSGYGNCIAGYVSDVDLTWNYGGEYNFNTASTSVINASFDKLVENRLCFSYNEGNYGKAKIATLGSGGAYSSLVPGTVFTFGSAATFLNAGILGGTQGLSFDPYNNNKLIVSYANSSTNYGGFCVGTITGATTLSFSSVVEIGYYYQYIQPDFNPYNTSHFLYVYIDLLGDSYVHLNEGIVTGTNLCKNSLLGILQETGTTGQTKTVKLFPSIDNNQSGLTIGQDYYLQPDGTLSTNIAKPGIKIGKAISSTAIKTIMP